MLLKNCQDPLQGLEEIQIKKFDTFESFIAFIIESEKRCQGINLEFPFPNCLSSILFFPAEIYCNSHEEGLSFIIQIEWPFFHLGFIPFEGICVPINHNEGGLGVQQS